MRHSINGYCVGFPIFVHGDYMQLDAEWAEGSNRAI